MSRSPFEPCFEELPATLPIFPLTGVLLLPGGRLPLNIFEPRYLAMTADALKAERMIGMVQPKEGQGDAGEGELYRTGCAGRMTAWSETDDGRYLIGLSGLARFDISEELPRQRLYRRVVPDWQPYRADLAADEEKHLLAREERARLVAALSPFLDRHGIAAEAEAIAATPDERLVTTVAMVCPFAPREKQALLEAADTARRAQLLTALLEMALLGGAAAQPGASH